MSLRGNETAERPQRTPVEIATDNIQSFVLDAKADPARVDAFKQFADITYYGWRLSRVDRENQESYTKFHAAKQAKEANGENKSYKDAFGELEQLGLKLEIAWAQKPSISPNERQYVELRTAHSVRDLKEKMFPQDR